MGIERERDCRASFGFLVWMRDEAAEGTRLRAGCVVSSGVSQHEHGGGSAGQWAVSFTASR